MASVALKKPHIFEPVAEVFFLIHFALYRSPNEGIFYRISDSAPVTISKEVDIDRSQLFHYGLVKVQKQKVHNTSLYVLKQNTAEYYF